MSTDLPYRNPDLDIDTRVQDLLSRMTIEEKVGQLFQMDGRHDPARKIKEMNIGSFLHVLGEEINRLQDLAASTRLGIPLLFGIDAIHGNNFWYGATVFPTQLALSSSWNKELVYQVARATAVETLASGVPWTFSPVFCLARDMRWGRVNETFGEDHYLIGELGAAMVEGYQGESLDAPDTVLACAKHLAAYSETQGGRDAAEADVSPRKLMTYFLPPFEKAVKAGCGSFMSAYEAINGVPCTFNSWLLTEQLREKWGFEGFVISDWNNVGWGVTLQKVYPGYQEASRDALLAGNDMVMETPDCYPAMVKNVKEGLFREEDLDRNVARVLKMKFQLGLFEGKKGRMDPGEAAAKIYTPEHKALALEAAFQSIVLLKNSNNVLPLPEDLNSIALIGPNGDDVKNQLGDWSSHSFQMGEKEGEIHPRENVVTLLDGLKRRHPGVRFVKGCGILHDEDDDIQGAVKVAEKSQAIILALGDNLALTGEFKDRANLDLSGKQMELFRALKATSLPLIVILINGKPLTVPEIAENADAVIEAWNPGLEGGTALGSILFGDRSPEGKLTISFPRHVGQQPVNYNQIPGWHADKYCDLPDNRPLFPFGYGLSYASFEYAPFTLEKNVLVPGEDLNVKVKITNTGRYDGVEIVQLYINDLVSSVTTPVKELKAFARVPLKAGESREVKMTVPFENLALVDRNLLRVVEPGEFEVMVGSSSRDEDLQRSKFTVTAKDTGKK